MPVQPSSRILTVILPWGVVMCRSPVVTSWESRMLGVPLALLAVSVTACMTDSIRKLWVAMNIRAWYQLAPVSSWWHPAALGHWVGCSWGFSCFALVIMIYSLLRAVGP